MVKNQGISTYVLWHESFLYNTNGDNIQFWHEFIIEINLKPWDSKSNCVKNVFRQKCSNPLVW